MAENKTKPTKVRVAAFLKALDDEAKRKDAAALVKLMGRITGEKGVMWGPSIVGFGKIRYKYASGREGDMCLTGFSPRKTALTIYIIPGFAAYKGILARLGKFKTGKSCLYVKRLADIDMGALEELIAASVAHVRKKYTA